MAAFQASVIIRAKNEAAGIGRTLDLLRRQTISADTEVIVVDSGSTDQTVAIARAAGAEVIEIPGPSFTFGSALNTGTAAASAPIVIALSAHAYPPDEQWLARMVGAFDNPRVACACGLQRGPDDEPLDGPLAQDYATALRRPEFGYSNAAGAYRRDLWAQRAFRPDLPGTEDKEWAWWWLRQGWLHIADPSLQVEHDHSKDPLRDQFVRSRREWVGYAMFIDLEPYGVPDLIREWWTEQGSYRSIARARLSHRRAVRLLGKYAGRSRLRLIRQQRIGTQILQAERTRGTPEALLPQRPMRIAVMVDRFPTLSETFVTSEARALQMLGHLVSVAAVTRSPQPNWPDAAGIRATFVTDEPSGQKLRALLWLTSRHPLGCARDLVRRRAWRRQEEVAALRALAVRARHFERLRYDHLHVHFAHRSALEAMRIGAIIGTPYSVTAHAWDIYVDRRNLETKLEQAAFATSGCDYTVSHLRELVDPDVGARIHRLVMGVDCDRFHRSRPLPGGRRILALGRLVEKKGYADLIDAAALLRERGAAASLTIVGEGPLREQLGRQIAELGLEGVVEMAGAASPDQVRTELEHADLLALPCVIAADGDRDSMPVAIKEAMSMELMVVGTDILGLPEMVDRSRGRLVPPHDSNALADAIEELLDLPVEQRAQIGAAGRAWVREHGDVAVEARRLDALIRTVADPAEATRTQVDPPPGQPASSSAYSSA